jgi:hypothetical protein
MLFVLLRRGSARGLGRVCTNMAGGCSLWHGCFLCVACSSDGGERAATSGPLAVKASAAVVQFTVAGLVLLAVIMAAAVQCWGAVHIRQAGCCLMCCPCSLLHLR